MITPFQQKFTQFFSHKLTSKFSAILHFFSVSHSDVLCELCAARLMG